VRLRPGSPWLLAGVLAFMTAAAAQESLGTDVASLNTAIGSDYAALVSEDTLVGAALRVPLVAYGEVHDQQEAARQFLRLADALRRRSRTPVRFGIEFVDRGDWDILARYLDHSLDESEFLQRLFPTSMLLLPEAGDAHLQILRYARRHHVEVLPLESRPAGARSPQVRDAEILWNLAVETGRKPAERLLVLYGVQHLVGPRAVTAGLEVPRLTISSYGDSILAAFARREGRYPAPGEVLRIRSDFYLQAVGGPPRVPAEWTSNPGVREPLLFAIENSYHGDWGGMSLLVAALDDGDVRWRRAAFHALRQAAERSYGYDPEANAAERRAGQERWAAWWSETQQNWIGSREASPGGRR
jgi:hypothetical protein